MILGLHVETIIGFVAGLACGFVMDEAVEIMKQNVNQDNKPSTSLLPSWATRLLIGISCVMLVLAGLMAWTVIKDEQFQKCQAIYNSRFDTSNDALFRFLYSAPPVLQSDPTLKEINEFRQNLSAYIKAYQSLPAACDEVPGATS